jgi:hypothetical protein
MKLVPNGFLYNLFFITHPLLPTNKNTVFSLFLNAPSKYKKTLKNLRTQSPLMPGYNKKKIGENKLTPLTVSLVVQKRKNKGTE